MWPTGRLRSKRQFGRQFGRFGRQFGRFGRQFGRRHDGRRGLTGFFFKFNNYRVPKWPMTRGKSLPSMRMEKKIVEALTVMTSLPSSIRMEKTILEVSTVAKCLPWIRMDKKILDVLTVAKCLPWIRMDKKILELLEAETK